MKIKENGNEKKRKQKNKENGKEKKKENGKEYICIYIYTL